MRHLILLVITSCFCYSASAQKNWEINFSAYWDFYSSSFDNESIDNYQPLTTVGSIPGRFKRNISLLGINIKHKYFRAQYTRHNGSIIGATWDSQLPNTQEAYVGLHIFPDFYADAGYFTTHIGMESFMPKENLLSSTSIITYNEPFYQRGARAVYEGFKNLELQFWVLDGYNLFRDNNDKKSIGLLASYEKNNLTVSYSNIIGQEPVLGGDALRIYHNMYTNYTFFKEIFEAQFSVDFATQQGTSLTENKIMLAYIAALRINITKRLSITGRYEKQDDKDGMIGGEYETGNNFSGINMSGYTGGISYEFPDRAYIRYEVRTLQNQDVNLQVFGTESNRIEQLFTVGLMFDFQIVGK